MIPLIGNLGTDILQAKLIEHVPRKLADFAEVVAQGLDVPLVIKVLKIPDAAESMDSTIVVNWGADTVPEQTNPHKGHDMEARQHRARSEEHTSELQSH